MSGWTEGELDRALDLGVAIAREAGLLTLHTYRAGPEVRFKRTDVDLVTQTDLDSEALIARRLAQHFPDHGLIAEEGTDRGGPESTALWIVDPLDGTVNFAHGFPFVAVSLGLLVQGRPAVGVVYDPLRDETFAAAAGRGSSKNGQRVRVSEVDRLSTAFLATGFPYDRRTAVDNNVERLDHFLRRSHGVRRAGSAALDVCYVACGRLDGFWEKGLHPWDIAAASLVLQEAGGRVTDFDGGPRYLSGEHVLASNGRIHDEMLTVLRMGANAPTPKERS